MNTELLGVNPHKMFLLDSRDTVNFASVDKKDLIYIGQSIINEAISLKSNVDNKYNMSTICIDTGIKKTTLYDWVDATARKTRTSMENLLRFSFDRNKRLVLRPMLDGNKNQTMESFAYNNNNPRAWYAEFNGYLYDNDALTREFMLWSNPHFLNALPVNKLSVISDKDEHEIDAIVSSTEQYGFDFNVMGNDPYFFDINNNDVKVACYGEDYNVRDTYALFRDFKYSRLTSGSPLSKDDANSIPHFYIQSHKASGINIFFDAFKENLNVSEINRESVHYDIDRELFEKEYFKAIETEFSSTPTPAKNSTSMLRQALKLKSSVNVFQPKALKMETYLKRRNRESLHGISDDAIWRHAVTKNKPLITRGSFLAAIVHNYIAMRIHCSKVYQARKITESVVVAEDIKKYIPLYSETEMLHENNKWMQDDTTDGIPHTDKSVRYRGKLSPDNLFGILMTGEIYLQEDKDSVWRSYESVYPKGTILIVSTRDECENNDEVIVQMRGGMRGLGTYNARVGRPSYLQRWNRDTAFEDLLFCTDAAEVARRDDEFFTWLKANPESDLPNANQTQEDLEKGWAKWNELKLGEIRDWVYKVVDKIQPK